jgi:hypothetical protein
MEQAVAEMVEAAVAAPSDEGPAEEAPPAEGADDDGSADEAPSEEPAEEPQDEPQPEAEAESEEAPEDVAEEAAAAVDADDTAEVDEETAEPAAEDEPQETPEPETPDYDYDALHSMNVHQLQEIAEGVDHEAVHGFTTMHKEELLHALCKAFGIEEHVHHEVVGIDKAAVKAKINALKMERDEALAAGDKKRLKRIRRRIHRLKHRIRKATV